MAFNINVSFQSPFARYVCYQDVTYLKRYSIAPVFRESKVLGSHPREHYECQFDVVTPSPGRSVSQGLPLGGVGVVKTTLTFP